MLPTDSVASSCSSSFSGASTGEVTADGKVFYEVLIETADEKDLEIAVDPKGKILKVTEIKEKGDEKDEKKD